VHSTERRPEGRAPEPGMPEPAIWGKADIHIHTAAGDGAASPAAIMDWVENHTDLTIIAITDHDEISGALEAQEIAARRNHRFEIIIGTEVTTLDGHLLGLFMKKRVPMFMSAERTIEAIHAQDGLCVVPHPMSPLAFSLGRSKLMRVAMRAMESIYFDGIETFNPTMAGRVAHLQTKELNRTTLQLAETGGSDGHQLAHIGTAYTVYPGRTAEDLRQAILERTSRSEGKFWTAGQHMNGLATQQWHSLICYPRQWQRRITDAFFKPSDVKPSDVKPTDAKGDPR
jgi:predicted metal-dependent phosphoesterase TrpH